MQIQPDAAVSSVTADVEWLDWVRRRLDIVIHSHFAETDNINVHTMLFNTRICSVQF